MINFPFGTNGKLSLLGVPILKHITVGLFCMLKVVNKLIVSVLLYRCNVVINFFENAHKVSVTEDRCEECGSNLLQVDFSKVYHGPRLGNIVKIQSIGADRSVQTVQT